MTLLRCKFKELLKHLTIRSQVCSDTRFQSCSVENFIFHMGPMYPRDFLTHVEPRLVFVLVSRSSRGRGWIAKYMNPLVTRKIGCHFQIDLATLGEVVRYDGGYKFGFTNALVSILS